METPFDYDKYCRDLAAWQKRDPKRRKQRRRNLLAGVGVFAVWVTLLFLPVLLPSEVTAWGPGLRLGARHEPCRFLFLGLRPGLRSAAAPMAVTIVAAIGRGLLEAVGAYTLALVTLDELWWSNHRNWRYLSAGALALILIGLLQLPSL